MLSLFVRASPYQLGPDCFEALSWLLCHRHASQTPLTLLFLWRHVCELRCDRKLCWRKLKTSRHVLFDAPSSSKIHSVVAKWQLVLIHFKILTFCVSTKILSFCWVDFWGWDRISMVAGKVLKKMTQIAGAYFTTRLPTARIRFQHF